MEYAWPDLQLFLESMEQNDSILEEQNFDLRCDAMDALDFPLTGPLKSRAEKWVAKLEAVNHQLFQRLREEIRSGKYRGEDFRNLIREYTGQHMTPDNSCETAYDNLDLFVNGLMTFQPIPAFIPLPGPEMVGYQKTPAGIVMDLTEKISFQKDDVFIDIGSGLGQLSILVHLLTGIQTLGIEIEPGFSDYANSSAASLGLSGVKFIQADARDFDYTRGTVFFMYTPFTGTIMEEVLTLLKNESRSRKIKVITYGPCTKVIALQSWLKCENFFSTNFHQTCIFES